MNNDYQQGRKDNTTVFLIATTIICVVIIFVLAVTTLTKSQNENNDEPDDRNSENIMYSEESGEYQPEEESSGEYQETTYSYDYDYENIAGLSAPVLSQFEGTPSSDGNGITVRINWNEIENADGYEVEETETELASGESYDCSIKTYETYFETSSSVDMDVKIRVRAFSFNGEETIYGEWSKLSECNINIPKKSGGSNKSTAPAAISYQPIKINNYRLPVYKEPDYQSSKYDYIVDRGEYKVTEQKGNWRKLSSGGWVNRNDAYDFGSTRKLGKGYVSTQDDPLNLRYAPTRNAEKLAKIPKGSPVIVYEITLDDWYYVYYNGIYGFVDSKYVTLGTEEKFTAYKIKVKNYNLEIHKQPDISSDITGHINDMDEYTITEQDSTGKWGKLKIGGWIKLSEAEEKGWTSDGLEAHIVTAKDPKVTLRYAPDAKSKKVAEIPKDAAVTACRTDLDDWYYVYYKGESGFVLAECVEFDDEKKETTTQTETTETTATETTTTTTTEEPATEPPATEPPVTLPPETTEYSEPEQNTTSFDPSLVGVFDRDAGDGYGYFDAYGNYYFYTEKGDVYSE